MSVIKIKNLILMLANMVREPTNLKYATFFSLFDVQRILNRERERYVDMAILFGVAVLLFGASMIFFHKRDLSI